MKYNVTHFIKKFEAIPEEKIITYSTHDGNGGACALGHCGNGDCCYYTPEYAALVKLFIDAGIKSFTRPDYTHSGWNVADVNNDNHPDYKQPTPKQRILAALNDIKISQINIDELRPLLINHKNLEIIETV